MIYDKRHNITDHLFVIYKNGVHLGNTRAVSAAKAVDIYILNSGFSINGLLNAEIIEQYKAIKDHKGIHFKP